MTYGPVTTGTLGRRVAGRPPPAIDMTWIDIAWPVVAGISLALGLINLLAWTGQRSQPALVMFSLATASVAVLAVCELLAMHAKTPQRYFDVLRVAHIPVAVLLVALVGHVFLQFRPGRAWLGITACGLRIAILIPSLLSGESLRFREITELVQIDLGGGAVASAPRGTANPAMFVAQISDLLLIAFLVDVIAAVWRRTTDKSERLRVAWVCGSMIVFVVIASAWAMLVSLGWLAAPLTVVVPFLGVLLVMSYDMGANIVRAAVLERQLKESRSDLRGTRQRLQLTADAVGLGTWTWNLNSNEPWLLQPHDDGDSSKTLLARLHPDDHETIACALDEAMSSGRFASECRLLRPDGDVHWISATGLIERAGSGAPVRMHGVFVDITARRQAEERFRLVVESSPTAMLMVDSAGCIALANGQAERVFGYSKAELLGQRIEMLVPTRSRAGHERYRTNLFEAPEARSMGGDRGIFGRQKDGSDVPVQITLKPIRVADDSFVLASVTDLSERLRNEQEIALQREELAHLSRISLLGEMSGSLAHELNQPLTAVLSNAQAALRFLDRDEPDLGEVRDSLVQIVENDKRAGEVIRRLRAMLRKEQVSYEKLQINDVVRDVLRFINSDLLNRNIATQLDLGMNLPAVRGDRVQLQQVLLNLVINACDAMEGIDDRRTLTLRTRTGPPSLIDIQVSDVGRGIPSQDLERIFTPFVTSKPHGMGFGLAVCRTIIEAHHGVIWATSNGASGATLHVQLPEYSAASGEAAE